VFSQSDVTPITSSEEAGVQDIVVPMCKNFLPYTKTKLPNRFGHSTQVEVYRLVIEIIEIIEIIQIINSMQVMVLIIPHFLYIYYFTYINTV